MTMSNLCLTFIFWFAIAYQCRMVESLEPIEQLICNNIEIGSRIPHPEFCNIYIICENKIAKSIHCQKNILYNPVKELCDVEYKNCASGLIRNEDGSLRKIKREIQTEILSKDIILTRANNKMSPSTNYLQRSSLNPLTCPIDDSDKLIFLSHPTKCSIYFICYHGKPIPMECSKGLHWSERNYKCIAKELSECYTRSLNQYPRCPPIGTDFLPHDKDCQKFWYCLHGLRMIQQCDAFFHWDVREKKCVKKRQAVCYSDLLGQQAS